MLLLAVDPAAALTHWNHKLFCFGLDVSNPSMSELLPACTTMNYLERRVALFKTAKTQRELVGALGYNYNFFEPFVFSKDIDLYYTEFSIVKSAKKERIIAAPHERLKQIQKNLADILLFIFRPKSCVHAFVKNKNIVSNALPHLKAKHVLRLDLKDFFPSIHFGRVRNLFEATPFNFPRSISTMIARICCYKGSLPQGAPTSPIISNMICLRMDAQLTEIARCNHCNYTRYADDITFSTNDEKISKNIVFSINPLVISREIVNIIENNIFFINNEKTNIRSYNDSKFVAGVKINSKLNITRTKYREIRAMLHAVKTYGHEKALEEHVEKHSRRKRSVQQKNFYDIISGKIAFMSMVRGNKDPLVCKLKNELLSIRCFEKIQKIDENLIIYAKLCGYSITIENGIYYIFLNLYKKNQKIGSIRQKISNGKIETNLQQFSNKYIYYVEYDNKYHTFEKFEDNSWAQFIDYDGDEVIGYRG